MNIGTMSCASASSNALALHAMPTALQSAFFGNTDARALQNSQIQVECANCTFTEAFVIQQLRIRSMIQHFVQMISWIHVLIAIHLIWILVRGYEYPGIIQKRERSFRRLATDMSDADRAASRMEEVFPIFHSLTTILCVLTPFAALVHEIIWSATKQRYRIVRTKKPQY